MPALRFLALGNSYTIGEHVAARNRWPNQLAKLLEGEGHSNRSDHYCPYRLDCR